MQYIAIEFYINLDILLCGRYHKNFEMILKDFSKKNSVFIKPMRINKTLIRLI